MKKDIKFHVTCRWADEKGPFRGHLGMEFTTQAQAESELAFWLKQYAETRPIEFAIKRIETTVDEVIVKRKRSNHA